MVPLAQMGKILVSYPARYSGSMEVDGLGTSLEKSLIYVFPNPNRDFGIRH
jgi:hypothetical protein